MPDQLERVEAMPSALQPPVSVPTPLAPTGERTPTIVVFDSGLGGLTVLAEVVAAMPGGAMTFVADDAVFPYGRLSESALVARVMAVMETVVAAHRPDIVVVACNTASTLVLPPLRARWPGLTIVGTVPAIKPAVALSHSRMISVLATPGTVARQYTRDLVAQFADGCAVTLVGSAVLAALAEAAMRGEVVDDAAIAAEIAPAFVNQDGRRTDAVVLACTHFPLLIDRLRALAPWPVAWIDPAPAIARRVVQMARERGYDDDATPGPGRAPMPAMFTSGRLPGPALRNFLQGRGLVVVPTAAF